MQIMVRKNNTTCRSFHNKLAMQDVDIERQDSGEIVRAIAWSPGFNEASLAITNGDDPAEVQDLAVSPELPAQLPTAIKEQGLSSSLRMMRLSCRPSIHLATSSRMLSNSACLDLLKELDSHVKACRSICNDAREGEGCRHGLAEDSFTCREMSGVIDISASFLSP